MERLKEKFAAEMNLVQPEKTTMPDKLDNLDISSREQALRDMERMSQVGSAGPGIPVGEEPPLYVNSCEGPGSHPNGRQVVTHAMLGDLERWYKEYCWQQKQPKAKIPQRLWTALREDSVRCLNQARELVAKGHRLEKLADALERNPIPEDQEQEFLNLIFGER